MNGRGSSDLFPNAAPYVPVRSPLKAESIMLHDVLVATPVMLPCLLLQGVVVIICLHRYACFRHTYQTEPLRLARRRPNRVATSSAPEGAVTSTGKRRSALA